MAILIKNGRIIDPANNTDEKADILVDRGRIKERGKKVSFTKARVVDASGKIVCPGLIDMHAHLREPGREDQETVLTGMRAAAAGGFTRVCAMPNTEPPCDSEAQIAFLKERGVDAGFGEVIPVGTITKRREGKEISEMGEMQGAGCIAVSDDGSGVDDAELMRRAMEYAAMLDLLVISHCEDKQLAAGGVMNEGYWSTALGLKPVPGRAESLMVERDIELAALTGVRLHIAHVSTAGSVEAVRRAKQRGIKVTAEVTPHHFTLTDACLKGYNTNMKVNPPLRGKEDVDALLEGLKDGTIDAIATDHAPHLESEKQKEFDYAPFGMIGFETAVSLGITGLVETGILTWAVFVDKLTAAPARILKLREVSLAEGEKADITIIDPRAEWVYEKPRIVSKSSNSPFLGRSLKGKVTEVMIGGRMVVEKAEITG